jgi:hypothetical protein
MFKLFAAALACVALTAAAAPACTQQSPAHAQALIELYTSEGCDSCPPADRYLSTLRGTPNAVVLSMHVDYWNDIGWQDPFSRKVFTERQRWLSDLAGSRTIYTPELFVGGRELRGGWEQKVPAAIARSAAAPARADIAITLGQPGPGGLPVDVRAVSRAGGSLYVALVENDLSSSVTAGENRGRTLHHDFVAREWLPPVDVGRDGKAALTRTLTLPRGAVAKNLGVAAFVQTAQGEVLQAFALPVCGN